jgi:hypothetical protein
MAILMAIPIGPEHVETRAGGKYSSVCADPLGAPTDRVDAGGTNSHVVVAESHFHFDVLVTVASTVDSTGPLRFVKSKRRVCAWKADKIDFEFDPGVAPTPVLLGRYPLEKTGSARQPTEAVMTDVEVVRRIDLDRLDDFKLKILVLP